jgi:hypothetical protein
VNGQTASPAGAGVNGVNMATTGGNGGSFTSNATSGYAAGVYAQSSSTNGVGVNGSATATSGNTNGVFGSAASPNGFGVQGFNSGVGGVGLNGNASANTGGASGVYGSSASPNGFGVQVPTLPAEWACKAALPTWLSPDSTKPVTVPGVLS